MVILNFRYKKLAFLLIIVAGFTYLNYKLLTWLWNGQARHSLAVTTKGRFPSLTDDLDTKGSNIQREVPLAESQIRIEGPPEVQPSIVAEDKNEFEPVRMSSQDMPRMITLPSVVSESISNHMKNQFNHMVDNGVYKRPEVDIPFKDIRISGTAHKNGRHRESKMMQSFDEMLPWQEESIPKPSRVMLDPVDELPKVTSHNAHGLDHDSSGFNDMSQSSYGPGQEFIKKV